MTPTHRATFAQLMRDATLAEKVAGDYPLIRSELLAMAARRRVLANALSTGGAPHTPV